MVTAASRERFDRISFKSCTAGVLLLSIFLMPYVSVSNNVSLRPDQILIPVYVILEIFILKVRIPKLVVDIITVLAIFSIIIPLISTVIFLMFNPQLSFVGTLHSIKELQNLLKPIIYILFGSILYFRISKNAFLFIIKTIIITISIASIILFLGFTSSFRTTVVSFYVNFYHLVSKAPSMHRFPGFLIQPATAGMYTIIMLAISVVENLEWYLIFLVILTGFLANTKVFWFSLPLMFLYFIIYVKNAKNGYRNYDRKKRKILKFIFVLILVILSIYLIINTKLYIKKMLDYIFGVISRDPLAGRGRNFVVKNTTKILNISLYIGIGLNAFQEMLSNYGTWDSGIYYDVAFLGSIFPLLKYVFLFWIFAYIPDNQEERFIFLTLFIFLVVLNFGINSFYQERVSDFLYAYIGYRLAYKTSRGGNRS